MDHSISLDIVSLLLIPSVCSLLDRMYLSLIDDQSHDHTECRDKLGQLGIGKLRSPNLPFVSYCNTQEICLSKTILQYYTTVHYKHGIPGTETNGMACLRYFVFRRLSSFDSLKRIDRCTRQCNARDWDFNHRHTSAPDNSGNEQTIPYSAQQLKCET